VGRYLGTGSFDWLWRFGKANGKGGGVGLDWITGVGRALVLEWTFIDNSSWPSKSRTWGHIYTW
jgi:hypothetical protein